MFDAGLLAIVGLAATAGLLAFFSPCGYALLPAYVGFFLARQSDAGDANSETDKESSKKTTRGSVKTGIFFGLSVVLGFVVVLAVAWIIIASVGNIFGNILPQLTFWVGLLLIILGAVFFFRPLKAQIRLPGWLQKGRTGYFGAFLFGVVYIIGGIGCTLPVFIAVLTQAATLGTAQSLLVFAVFSGTMALLMLVITILLIVARVALFNKLKKILPFIQRAGALLLVIAGIVLVVREYSVVFNG
ncbi:MAG: cytochrome c biogenesis CcdA family protein [Candidatus Paceibacterota bacterium]